jgi:hypothetical protein
MAQPSRSREIEYEMIEILFDDDIGPATGPNTKDVKGKRTANDAEGSMAAQDEVSETLQDIRSARNDLLDAIDSFTSNVY